MSCGQALGIDKNPLIFNMRENKIKNLLGPLNGCFSICVYECYMVTTNISLLKTSPPRYTGFKVVKVSKW